MQESTGTGLWFSPDYNPQLKTTAPVAVPQEAAPSTGHKPVIQLPQGKSTAPHRDERALNILIWSNSTQEAEHIQTALRSTGFSNLWYAVSYSDGLEKIKSIQFDFFIIDLTIDGVGTRLVKALRSSLTYRNTPMLICTESQLVQDMLHAMKAGANDLICKPVNAALLSKKISLHSRMMLAA